MHEEARKRLPPWDLITRSMIDLAETCMLIGSPANRWSAKRLFGGFDLAHDEAKKSMLSAPPISSLAEEDLRISEVIRNWIPNSIHQNAKLQDFVESGSFVELGLVFTSLGHNDFPLVVKCEWEIPLLLNECRLQAPTAEEFLTHYVVLVARNEKRDPLVAELEIEAATCMDYVRRNMGETGCELLLDIACCLDSESSSPASMLFRGFLSRRNMLEILLAETNVEGTTDKSRPLQYLCRHLLSIAYDDSSITVEFQTTPQDPDIWSLYNTLSWICSAIRQPRGTGFILSTSVCMIRQRMLSVIPICWNSLFATWSFPPQITTVGSSYLNTAWLP